MQVPRSKYFRGAMIQTDLEKNADDFLVKHESLISKFKKEISDRVKEIDPYNDLGWDGFLTDWALANGLSVKDADTFCLTIGYHSNVYPPLMDFFEKERKQRQKHGC